MGNVVKLPEFQISEANPFENDKLDRKEPAVALTSLVGRVPGPLVMSLSGVWGTGKTVFLKMWGQHLKNEGFQVLYFSAWEDDYCDDALVAIIGQLWGSLKNSDFGEIANSVKECAASVVKSTTFSAIRVATGGIVDLTEEQLKSSAEKAVDDYIEAGQKLKDLRMRLTELSASIREKTKNPLVFIIDELDRCRPSFAIEMLERVKHLFDVPGIVFVLGIAKDQIAHSIKGVYGQGMNADGYLRRFIDLDFILPRTSTRQYTLDLFRRFGVDGCDRDQTGQLADAIAELCEVFDLGLREREHAIAVASMAYMSGNDARAIPELLAMLIVLKIVDNNLYENFMRRKASTDDVMARISTEHRGVDFICSPMGVSLLGIMLKVSTSAVLRTRIAGISSGTTTMDNTQLPRWAQMLKNDDLKLALEMGKAHFLNRVDERVLDHLARKIEIAALFKKGE